MVRILFIINLSIFEAKGYSLLFLYLNILQTYVLVNLLYRSTLYLWSRNYKLPELTLEVIFHFG